MLDKLSEPTINEVNQLLKDCGLELELCVDWNTGLYEIKFQGQTVFTTKNQGLENHGTKLPKRPVF